MTKKKEELNNDFSKDQKNLWLVLNRARETETFQKDLQAIRKTFFIPPKGFRNRPNPSPSYYSSFDFPKNWLKLVDERGFNKFDCAVNELANKHQLGVIAAFPAILYWVIFYNMYVMSNSVGKIILVDMPREKKRFKRNHLTENYQFPVGILISPHASKEEVLDFIETHKKNIKALQNKYVSKAPSIRKVRSSELTDRTKFVIKMRSEGKLYREIVDLVYEKYGVKMKESDIRARVHHHTKGKDKRT